MSQSFDNSNIVLNRLMTVVILEGVARAIKIKSLLRMFATCYRGMNEMLYLEPPS